MQRIEENKTSEELAEPILKIDAHIPKSNNNLNDISEGSKVKERIEYMQSRGGADEVGTRQIGSEQRSTDTFALQEDAAPESSRGMSGI